jgi:hypothetical protein
MEGQDLLSLVKGRMYNAELRAELAKFGLRRIGGYQWVSKATANKYELIVTEDGDEKVVSGVDAVEKDQRIHLMDVEEKPATTEELANANITVHHKTLEAISHQIDVTYDYLDLIDQWNMEIDMDSPIGRELEKETGGKFIQWSDLIFLPDPLASGEYLFGAIRQGKAASIHSWLDLPNGDFIVPTDGSEEAARDSLKHGLKFHLWEKENFETAAAAGQYTIRALNNSKTTYALAIKKLLGKENAAISRNDFYRNDKGQMCRIEVSRTEAGIAVVEKAVEATVAECIDSLLAPYIKAKAFDSIGKQAF